MSRRTSPREQDRGKEMGSMLATSTTPISWLDLLAYTLRENLFNLCRFQRSGRLGELHFVTGKEGHTDLCLWMHDRDETLLGNILIEILPHGWVGFTARRSRDSPVIAEHGRAFAPDLQRMTWATPEQDPVWGAAETVWSELEAFAARLSWTS